MPQGCIWEILCINFNSILHVCIGVSMCMLRLVNISPKKRLYFALQSPLHLCKIWSHESLKTSVIFIVLESYKTWQYGCFCYYESLVVGYWKSFNVCDDEHEWTMHIMDDIVFSITHMHIIANVYTSQSTMYGIWIFVAKVLWDCDLKPTTEEVQV
jgi:hypothetical protein